MTSAPVFDAELKKIFDNFESWLLGADGGSRGTRCRRATQCRRQVELVVNYIDSSSPSLTNILQRIKLRNEWLNRFEKEKQPGTTKSYLGSLAQFYSFLKCENIDVNVSPEQLTSLIEQTKLWARSFRKKSQDRFWEKRMEDMSSMKTPGQIKEFDTSHVARAAISLLGRYEKEDDTPSQVEYTSVRDYLLTTICINNGSRSGTLANMTLGEFEAATEEDGCFVVRVKEHKTFTTHGPVNVVFTASLHRYTKIFVAKFRNSLGDVSTDACSPLFLSTNQSKMHSSQVGAQIGACWGKVFGKKTSAGGATSFRKAAVPAVHERKEEMRGDLANLMVHKSSTADRYYLLQNKSKSAVKTSKELAKIMRSGDGPSTKRTGDLADDDVELSSRHSESSPGRYKWTPAQVLEVKSAFASNIKHQSITMEQVRDTVIHIPLLQGIPEKKVRDKVRSFFGKDTLVVDDLPSLPTERESLDDRLRRAGLKEPKSYDGKFDFYTQANYFKFQTAMKHLANLPTNSKLLLNIQISWVRLPVSLIFSKFRF